MPRRESNKDRLERARMVRDEITSLITESSDVEEKEDLRAVRRVIEDKVEALEERRDNVRVAARAVAETAVTPMRVVGLNSPADTIVQVTEHAAVAIYDRMPPKDETKKSNRSKEEKSKSETPKVEAPKAEAPKSETSKVEAPKSEAP